MERGRLTLTLGPTDVASVVRTVAAEQADGTPGDVEVQDGLPAAVADDDRLHQVVSNLVVNHRKYSPGGSPVVVEARGDQGWVLVSVEDHGRGPTCSTASSSRSSASTTGRARAASASACTSPGP